MAGPPPTTLVCVKLDTPHAKDVDAVGEGVGVTDGVTDGVTPPVAVVSALNVNCVLY